MARRAAKRMPGPPELSGRNQCNQDVERKSDGRDIGRRHAERRAEPKRSGEEKIPTPRTHSAEVRRAINPPPSGY